MYLILWRYCGFHVIFNIAATVPACRSSQNYSSISVGESPHSGTAFSASNAPVRLSQLPCPTTCSTGGGVGGWLLQQRPCLPHFHLQILWLNYFLPPPSQASSTTSHWAILLCQPLESCFLTFPCVFREASYIIFMLMGFRWVFFKTPPCSLQTYFFSGALRNCTAKPFK